MENHYGITAWDKNPARFTDAQKILDLTHRAKGVEWFWDKHGPESARMTYRVQRRSVLRWRTRLTGAHLAITCRGQIVWEGRIEDPSVVLTGDWAILTIQAFGYWRALFDIPCQERWSDTTYDNWYPLPTTDLSARKPDQFNSNTDGRLYTSLRQNVGYGTTVRFSWKMVSVPHAYQKYQTLAFTLDGVIPTNWQLVVQAANAGYASLTTLGTITAGTYVASSQSFASINREWLILTWEDTRTTTALTVARTAGVNVTFTVGTTASMVVGSRIAIGGAQSEITSVLSIISGTQFTATCTYNHAIGDTITFANEAVDTMYSIALSNVRVKASASASLYSHEVAAALVAQVYADNPTQISNVTGLLRGGVVDLKNFGYAFTTPAAVIEDLEKLVDSSGAYRYFVDIGQVLNIDGPFASAAPRTFYVHGVPELGASLEQLGTQIVPAYTDTNGTEQVASTIVSTPAEAIYSIKRRQVRAFPTTSSSEAASWGAADLKNRTEPDGWGTITTEKVYAGRTAWPPHELRPWDGLVLVDLPSDGGNRSVRNFRFGRYGIRLDDETRKPIITIEPPNPIPTIDAVLAGEEIKTPIYEQAVANKA